MHPTIVLFARWFAWSAAYTQQHNEPYGHARRVNRHHAGAFVVAIVGVMPLEIRCVGRAQQASRGLSATRAGFWFRSVGHAAAHGGHYGAGDNHDKNAGAFNSVHLVEQSYC